MTKLHLLLLLSPALLACSSSPGDTASTTAGTNSGSGAGSSTSGSSGAGGNGGTTANGGASASGGGATGGGATGGAGTGGGPATIVVGGNRPATVYIPPNYVSSTPVPLLVMLHGYTATGEYEEEYLQLLPQAQAQGFLYVHPDGTIDAAMEHFWNATDACCNFFGSTVDDEGYLMGLITEISSKLSVDPKRIYFMGHSNGGFMAYRMACHHADTIAAIAVLAGEMYADLSQCQPTDDVSLLHMQGTGDMTILYDGGSVAVGEPAYPSATTSVQDWVTFDGCTPTADTSTPNADYVSTIPGAETTITKYGGCAKNTDVALWTLGIAPHIPTFTPAFAPDMTGWLMAHKKQ